MAHGGARPGAGRKPGTIGIKKQKSLARIAQAAEEGITPLEVMLQTMRALWAKGTDEACKDACDIAKDAAPFLHHKLSSVDMSADVRHSRPPEEMTDDELLTIAAGGGEDAAEPQASKTKPN